MSSIRMKNLRNQCFKRHGFILIVSLIVCLSGCGGAHTSEAPKGGNLNIICWSEYLPDEIVRAFEKESGMKVNITTFTSPDEMLAKVQNSAPGTYDMIIAPGTTTTILEKQGLIVALDEAKIPNALEISSVYKSTPNDPENKYSIPYLCASLVIAVNTDVIKDEITSYEDLTNIAYQDSMVVVEDPRAMVAIAMLAKGYSVNDTSDEALEAAKTYFNEIKLNIHAFNGDSPKTLMINGECPLGIIYGGECAAAMDQNPAIIGIYPEEGIYFGADVMMKTKDGKNAEGVETFMNYICEPKVSAQISSYFPYINPNEGAKAFLSEDFLNNPIKNIPKEQIEKSEPLIDIGESLSQIISLWTAFKG